MPQLSRSQVALYAALVFVVVLVGTRVMHAPSRAPDVPGAGGGSAASDDRPQASQSSTGEDDAPTGVAVSSSSDASALVHVAGAVRHPGVYRMSAGSRVNDAVRRAGGRARGADLDQINLAAKVSDGQQILVPKRGAASAASEASTPAAGEASSATPGAQGPPIGLNSATPEQLDTLDGVGPATVAKIVAYRQAHGGFRSVDELGEIPGIGPKRLAAIKPRVHV